MKPIFSASTFVTAMSFDLKIATAAPPVAASLFIEMPVKLSLASMPLTAETHEWHWQIKVKHGALAKLASKERHLHLRVVIALKDG
jgi:hypothetical protein